MSHQNNHWCLVYACLSEVQKVHSAIFTMSEIIQQRSSIKFCVRNQISGAETFRMLQKAFGDNCMSRASVFDWYKLFKEGRERVDDEQVKNQGPVDSFLRLSRCGALRIPSDWPNCQQGILFECYASFARSYS